MQEGRKFVTLQKVIGPVALVAMIAAMVMVFLYAPEERTLGNVQRIFYFHVASAWNGYLSFGIVSLGSLVYLFRRHLFWDRVASVGAELGVLFTSLTMITGSLWARPVWNTWWTWDPRLTATLVMWFMGVGYLLLRSAIDGKDQRARLSSVFGVIAFLTVPFAHFSVRWWRSLHPNVLADEGWGLHPSMIWTLLVAVIAFTLVNVYLFAMRLHVAQLQARVDSIKDRLRRVQA